jgi:TPR repeat protein
MAASKKSRRSDAEKLFSRADREWDRGKLRSAFRLFLAAAKAGDRAAQTNIGYFYDNGIGIRRDQGAALYWYRRAYRRGDASAANNIATIWRDKNKPQRALAWFRRAVRLGSVGSNLDIAKHYLRNESDSRKAIRYLSKACRSNRVSEADQEEASQLLKTTKRNLKSVQLLSKSF